MSQIDFYTKYLVKASRDTYSDLLTLLLANRGISESDRDAFCSPKWNIHGHDPFLMHNMREIVKRVWQAIRENESVIIYSDYDADGVPGAVVLSDFFNKIGFDNYKVHIPNRNSEGFGLNHQAVEQCIKDEVNLLITIDCGMADLDEIKALQEAGIEVIITDHHLPTAKGEPDCLILNPKQTKCQYPFSDLCGSGVIFKLIQAMLACNKKNGWSDSPIIDGWEKWLLDMVGIATICDMVPLVDENRLFAYYGLKVLHKSQRPGLHKMLELARVNQASLSAQDVAFTLGPRINAASRLGEPMVAFDALRATNGDIMLETRALAAAEELERVNRQRKTRVATACRAAYAKLDQQESDRQVLVVGDTNWPLGIVGLIAGSLANHYAKPAFVWTRVDDMYRGSVRAGNGESIHDLMSGCKDSFTSFGGHTGAGGFVCSQDQIHLLPDSLERAFKELPTQAPKREEIDTILSIDEITYDTFRTIQSLEPHGFGNPAPQFLLENIRIEAIKSFGKDNAHLSLSFLNSSGRIINAIQFNSPHLGAGLPSEGDRINLVATLELNTYRGNSELRLRIIDICTV
ncbi:MAG: single-stranded-DNA-specific exonuclease RecJ [Patescibacteria group bacterium]